MRLLPVLMRLLGTCDLLCCHQQPLPIPLGCGSESRVVSLRHALEPAFHHGMETDNCPADNEMFWRRARGISHLAREPSLLQSLGNPFIVFVATGSSPGVLGE